MKRKIKIINAILVCFITLPIWLYLIYTLLKAAHVDRLVWFLFWVYVPVSFLTSFLTRLGEADLD